MTALYLLIALASTQFITTKGKRLVDKDGKVFMMKGMSLGNWLLPEGYMFGFTNVNSPRMMNTAFSEMLDPKGAFDFWETWRANYIQEKDIKLIKDIGFNFVRLPFNSKLFFSEEWPEIRFFDYGLRYIDQTIQWCKKYGL